MYQTNKPYTETVLDIISKTWKTSYCTVEKCGPYTLTKMINSMQVDHTDGIGTKGFYHWQERTFAEAAQDAFAMNFNDLLLMNARPAKLQNHLMLPKDDHKAILATVTALVDLCIKHGVALTGGETSIHDNIMGMDLSISMTGLVAKKFNSQFKVGDTVIAYPSNGMHSNGFTLLTRQVREGKMTVTEEFVLPTRIYSSEIWRLGHERFNGIAHITGGAFTKLSRFLEPGADVELDMPDVYPNIFGRLSSTGIPCEVMYKTFNCGWGMLISTPNLDEVQSIAPGTVLGKVVEGTGKVKIKSAFSDAKVVY